MANLMAEATSGLMFAVARRWRRSRKFFQATGLTQRRIAGLEGDARTLARYPGWAYGTRSAKRINALLEVTGADRYLEIGVEYGHTFEAVRCRVRIGVDPNPRFRLEAAPPGVVIHPITSDLYFQESPPTRDLNGAFVDGLHEFRQTYRDLIAVIQRLRPGGFVLVDDVFPPDEISGIPSEQQFRRAAERQGNHSGAWMGDVWRVILALDRFHQHQLDWRTIIAANQRMQTLVWQSTASQVAWADTADLDAITTESYANILGGGLPPLFRATDWQEALADFRSHRMSNAE